MAADPILSQESGEDLDKLFNHIGRVQQDIKNRLLSLCHDNQDSINGPSKTHNMLLPRGPLLGLLNTVA
jgi:hypothetical protein